MLTRSPSENRTPYNREIHHRRSVRLKAHDYFQPGAYFVTICTRNKECLFGKIVNGEMRENEYGRVIQVCWDAIPSHFSHVEIDEFTVMPNHVHGILILTNHPDVGATHASPVRKGLPRGPKPHSLGAVVGSFKSAVTKRINVHRNTPGLPVWHRNYYEHVVRNEAEINRIREYIAANPSRWLEDEENPVHSVGATGRSPVQ